VLDGWPVVDGEDKDDVIVVLEGLFVGDKVKDGSEDELEED
jgi:hypothetical protein